MQVNLTLLEGFNNYYNRVVRKFNNLEDYTTWATNNNKNKKTLPDIINFNPNDYVNTIQVINWEYNWRPDYIITSDILTNEMMRWFVIESVRLRGNQYQLQLRRDLLVDYFDATVDAPCFIEKATLKSSDPFIYNAENMTTNQIKTEETLLRDETNCAWIVGYFDPDDRLKNKEFKGDQVDIYDISYSGTYEKWKESVGISIDSGTIYHTNPNNASIGIGYRYTGSNQTFGNTYCGVYTNDDYSSLTTITDSYGGGNQFLKDNGFLPNIYGLYIADGLAASEAIQNYDAIFNNLKGSWNNIIERYNDIQLTNGMTETQLNKLLQYNNKIIRFGTSEYSYKRITFKRVSNSASKTELFSASIKTTIVNLVGISNGEKGSPQIKTGPLDTYQLEITDFNEGQYRTEFPPEFLGLIDAPYSLFCIPYNKPEDKTEVQIFDGNTPTTIDSTAGFRIAQSIAKELGGLSETSFIYDLQLLPYCPVRRIINYSQTTGEFLNLNLANEKESATVAGKFNSYCPIYKAGTTEPVSYIFFADRSEFTLNIPISRNFQNKKIEGQTDFYRLVSPNYNGQFEFNLVKNNGLSYINVDCTYKPYNPYIHLNPNFGGLYGDDYNDSRGLICNGDFSLTVISDAWENYQIANKNYQNIFNRDIQNMETKNTVGRQRDIYTGITGTLTGGITGGLAGSKGGLAGIIAGTALGTATAGIGGGLNYNWNETLRNEAIDYKIDQFGYYLDNIQALPQSISKTTAFTYNNKIFPILEYYTCTDEEKIALANKIAYNGMTVMRIGNINEFINNEWSYIIKDTTITSKNYIKGQIIRLEDINCDDFHVANEIAAEVSKGAFYETKI